jgi:hypothetical protein
MPIPPEKHILVVMPKWVWDKWAIAVRIPWNKYGTMPLCNVFVLTC